MTISTKDKPTDRVIFRMIQGKVDAFLPDSDVNWGRIMCYTHIGQHGEASMDYYYKGRPATPEEYADLLQELKDIGYNPRVMKRITAGSINWVK